MVPHFRVEQDAELHSARVQQQAYYYLEKSDLFFWDTLYQIESAMMDMSSWEELQAVSIPVIREESLDWLLQMVIFTS